MRNMRGIFLALVVVITLVVPRYTVAQDEARYFPETGHWVTGKFLDFYESVAYPELLYGYPITDAFQTASVPQNPGLLVQYFQKVRLEYHPENPSELEVVRSPLGEYLYEINGPGIARPSSSLLGSCRKLPADGFPVCYDFLKFYDAYGGIAQFGYPISTIEYHHDRMVQNFQWARFEWRFDLPPGERIVISDLGKQYFDLYESSMRLLPNADDYIANVLSLKTRAFLSKAVAAPDDSLILYVIVQDQNLQGVQGTQVSVIVRFSNGIENRYLLDPTNEHGFTRFSFDLHNAPYGMAEILVTVSNDLLQTQTRTSLRIW